MLMSTFCENLRSVLFKNFVVWGVTFVSAAAIAHHSFQAFDMQRSIVFEGVLSDFSLTNPHAYFTLQVIDPMGEIESWEFETVNGSTLRRLGISEDTFALGEQLSIEAHPPRNSARRLAAAELITKADGTELAVSLRRAPLPARDIEPVFASSIEGAWLGPALASGLFTLQAGRVKETWPLTEKGIEAIEAYDGSQNPSAYCTPYAAPAVMLVPAPIVVAFGEGIIEMRVPNEGAIRLIFMDGRSLPEDFGLSNQGYSIGRWEDEVLVVETTLFEEHRIGNAFGLPGGVEKRLVERFSLNQDRSRLDYSFILEDPEFLSAQVAHSVQWTSAPNSQVEILDCDPEAARRFLNAY